MREKGFWIKLGVGLVIGTLAVGFIGVIERKQHRGEEQGEKVESQQLEKEQVESEKVEQIPQGFLASQYDQEGVEERLSIKKKDEKQEKEQLLTEKEAILFTKWYMCYQGHEIPSHIEVDHEEENAYVVYAYNNTLEDEQESGTYRIDKQSGEVLPVREPLFSGDLQYKDPMTYKIEDEMLWMIDEQGNKGRLLDLTTLYSLSESKYSWWNDFQSKGEYLGQQEENIYFAIRRVESVFDRNGYCVDTLYRYDLLKRKAIVLAEEKGVLNSPVDIHLELEGGTIILENQEERYYFKCQRVDAFTGELIEYIEPNCGRGGNYYFAKEEGLIYEVISPKEEGGYFISEYNEQTKQQRLVCKISNSDYYDGQSVDPPVKDGDIIYFMDYTYYSTPEEEKVSRKGNPVYCQVNVKTGQVSRVSPEAMKEYFKDKEELCFWSLQD